MDAFRQVAVRRPDAEALVELEQPGDGSRLSISYAELLGRAVQLAERLRAQGVTPGDRVAILLERSADVVVSMLAVLEAGGTWIALDPESPAFRTGIILAECQPRAILTRMVPPDLPAIPAIDPGKERIRHHARPSGSGPSLDSGAPAYIIYTSGSTGIPKGVVIPHGNVLALLEAASRFGFGSNDTWTLFHSPAFDFSVWEIWGALLHGGRLVIVPRAATRDPFHFREILSREKVTVLNATPSAFRLLSQADAKSSSPLALRLIIFGGEALEPYRLADWCSRHGDRGPELFNMYGITETTVHVTARRMTGSDLAEFRSFIGQPIQGWDIVLMDPDLEPVPSGEVGEICVGGEGLAIGYLGHPDLTAERFVPHPRGSREGLRLYRSGDLGRYTGDGDLEFLGRADRQVQVRGYRVELGEVEVALLKHPEIAEAVVEVRPGIDGAGILVAWIVGDSIPTVSELRGFLQQLLPEYMVPATFLRLHQLPLTRNGKLDRAALVVDSSSSLDDVQPGEDVDPGDALEGYLVGLWSRVLDRPVSRTDDFFALGGSSLTGANLIGHLQEELGEIVNVVAIFDRPTVDAMATFLREKYSLAIERRWGLRPAQEFSEESERPLDRDQIERFESFLPIVPRLPSTGVNPPAVFILAPPRSGTTLLRVFLGGHPDLFAPPELELLGWKDLAERAEEFRGRHRFWREGLIRAWMEVKEWTARQAEEHLERAAAGGCTTHEAYRELQAALGRRRLVDKTPSYALSRTVLERAEQWFSSPFYIHLLRHPEAVIHSFEEARLDEVLYRRYPGFTNPQLAELHWLTCHRNILQFLKEVPAERQMRLRFEDLVGEPVEALSEVCRRLGLGDHRSMADPYAEPGGRMMDGVYPISRALGDAKFLQHHRVDPGTAERWRSGARARTVGIETCQLAAAMDYECRLPPPRVEPPFKRRPHEGAPLSFAQERLWFMHQMGSGRAYHITTSFHLIGSLDVTALRSALAEVMRRHEVLRSRFPVHDGQPMQVPLPPSSGEKALAVVDLRSTQGLLGLEAVRRIASCEAARPFDLESGPAMRSHVYRLSPLEHLLVIQQHHIVADGTSLQILFREVGTLYRALACGRSVDQLHGMLPELGNQYADFAFWQRMSGESFERQIASMRHLAEVPALNLPLDHPRPKVRRYRGSSKSMTLSALQMENLQRLAESSGTTLFMVLLTAFAALLHRLTGQPDIVVGSPVVNRRRVEVKDLIGCFVEILVLRADLSSDPSFEEMLQRMRRVCLQAYRDQPVPFEELVKKLNPARSLDRSPIFQAMFSLRDAESDVLRLEGVECAPFPLFVDASQLDLSLAFLHDGASLRGTWTWDADLFDLATIDRWSSYLDALLTGIAADPSRHISDLTALTECPGPGAISAAGAVSEGQELPTVHELMAAQAVRTPDTIAIEFEGEHLTYSELESLSGAFARQLIAERLGPEGRVGIRFERRGLGMVVAMLAVLRAGYTYIPIDPLLPASRIAAILDHARPDIVLTESQVRLQGVQPRRGPLRVEVDSRQMAYIIYTSGSTGEPKGVAIPHRALSRCLLAMARRPGLTSSSVMLGITSLSFDISALELFLPVICGARLVVCEEQVVRSPDKLAAKIREAGATVIQATPSTLRLLVEDGWDGAPRLRLWSGGEALESDLASALLPRCQELWNLYGPTESTIWSTVERVTQVEGDEVARITVGNPIDGTKVHILGEDLTPAPIGATGELCLSGEGLARGYVSRPELTAESFRPDPAASRPGMRIYRTGDVARRLEDGRIELLGRRDFQVKIRGVRIELGEVETVLASHPAVLRAVVMARSSDLRRDRQLVAYLKLASGCATPDVDELREFLRRALPEVMVPGAFVWVETFPLTAGGKLDRAALAAQEIINRRESRLVDLGVVGPRDGLESEIATLWQRILGVEELGIHDNFFELGGHSLQLVELRHAVERQLGVCLSVAELSRYPTISLLARRLAQGESVPAPRVGVAPASPRKVPDRAVAVIGMSARFPGSSDLARFQRNLQEGREAITFFTASELAAAVLDPDTVSDPRFVPARGVLGDIGSFDSDFFGISPGEAALMDPQHRIFLECAWHAIEDAGHVLGNGQRVGVFAGTREIFSLSEDGRSPAEVMRFKLGTATEFLASRLSYRLNLKGPSLTVQTACSTALVAVHLACQSLLSGECDIALAGAARIRVPEVGGHLAEEGGIMAVDGHCRAFDARASGTVGGHGVGVVVLKPLAAAVADGDNIRAVIRGSAVNNDGNVKIGFSAPSIDGQADVVTLALDRAGLSPDTIEFVETHGTGTFLGDPIEVTALTRAFRRGTNRKRFCALCSVKTNIGHLDVAAGIAGLIRAVLALEHRELTPSLHFETPNPEVNWVESPFYVNTEVRPWPRPNGHPRRAGVSSFGLGGTNAHVVLEEAPVRAEGPSGFASRRHQLLVLSAKTAAALERSSEAMVGHLRETDLGLADIAFTLQAGRQAFEYRRALVAPAGCLGSAADELLAASRTPACRCRPRDNPEVVFLFPGQGTALVGLGSSLYSSEAVFREEYDRCCEILDALRGPGEGLSFRPLAPGEPGELERMARFSHSQIRLFVVEHALAQHWIRWGIEPCALLGHSLGELVAACVAGVFELEDALALIAHRSALIETLPPGAMLAVSLSEKEVASRLTPGLTLAAVNSANRTVVSGTVAAIETFWRDLVAENVPCKRLAVSHAFHSPWMSPITEAFREIVHRVPLKAPRRTWISSLSGQAVSADQACDPEHWVRHLVAPVRFADGLAEALQRPGRVLLEVGPGNALRGFLRSHPANSSSSSYSSMPRDASGDEAAHLLETLGRLWLDGFDVDWHRHHHPHSPRRVSLPVYPFERRPYAVCSEASNRNSLREGRWKRPPRAREETSVDWLFKTIWRQSPLPGNLPRTKSHAKGRWLCFDGPGDFSETLIDELAAAGIDVLRVRPGACFQQAGPETWTIDPSAPEHYRRLVEDLDAREIFPERVLHCWNLGDSLPSSERAGNRDEAESFLTQHLERGFLSLTGWVQAVEASGFRCAKSLVVLSDSLHTISAGDLPSPDKATLLSACRAIAEELPRWRCRSIDIDRQGRDATPAERGELVSRLLREIALETRLDSRFPIPLMVAYRRQRRFIQDVEPLSLATTRKKVLSVSGKNYLVTGGLGRMGLAIASFLVERGAAGLVLTSRSGLPSRPTWDRWSETHGEDDLTSLRIARVRDLEARGAEVITAAVGTENIESMRELLRRAEMELGEISGIIHAAGITRFSDSSAFPSILETRVDHLKRHIRPKAAGLWALDRLFADRRLDFRIAMSSISTILGGRGYSCYAAGNLYLDTFAGRRRHSKGDAWMSIGWDGWLFESREPGQVNRSPQVSPGYLRSDEGQQALDLLLKNETRGHLFVSTLDLRTRLAAASSASAGRNQKPSRLIKPPDSDLPDGALEQQIADVWREVLGVDQVGRFDSLYDLGADSLVAVQVASRLTTTLGTQVSVRMLHSYPVLSELAHEIEVGGLEEAATAPPARGSLHGVASGYPVEAEEVVLSIRLERRPLESVFLSGELAPVDAAALSYLPAALLQHLGLARKGFAAEALNHMPYLEEAIDTPWGRIALLRLPVFGVEVYDNRRELLARIVQALEMSARLGARCVSLTALLPSATDYGAAVLAAIADRPHLPTITTGHGATSAAVVLNIEKILAESSRLIEGESVAVVGLGSIGAASLRLLLRVLPHPVELFLCDVPSKLDALRSLERELREKFDFRGEIRLLPARAGVPAEVYGASLILGATNAADVVDVDRLRPGTLIVDDSAPHCFAVDRGWKRLAQQRDILFTEGGVLRSPVALARIQHIPSGLGDSMDPTLLSGSAPCEWAEASFNIFGCILSSLLTDREPHLAPTIGQVDAETSMRFWRSTKELGLRGSALHTLNRPIPSEYVAAFRERFGADRRR